MNLLSQIVAGFFALALVGVFVMETFFHDRKELYSFTLIKPEDVGAVRMWAFNLGFYNLSYAIGLITGLVLLHTPWAAEGRALVLFGCAAHVALGVVLYISEHRLWVSTLLQSGPPLIVLVAYWLWG